MQPQTIHRTIRHYKMYHEFTALCPPALSGQAATRHELPEVVSDIYDLSGANSNTDAIDF